MLNKKLRNANCQDDMPFNCHYLTLLLTLLSMPVVGQAQGCGLDYSSLRNHYGGIYDSPSTNGRWSFLGIKNNGQVRDWGWYGSTPWVLSPPNSKKIVRALSHHFPNYIALSEDNELFVFGKLSGDFGLQDLPPLSGKKYRALFSNYLSFAVLDEQGRVYSWGGGVQGLISSTREGYANVFSTHTEFAALHQDGHIISWGSSDTSPQVMFSGKKGFTHISSSHDAFAALDDQGQIHVWGEGGAYYVSPPTDSGYVSLHATSVAFTALHQDGRVESWGHGFYWLKSNPEYAPPPNGDYIQIHATGDPYDNAFGGAFAALDTNGRIYAWGHSSHGGTGAPSGTGFVKISSTAHAFAALREDGSIVSWGLSDRGGTGAPSGTTVRDKN